MLSLQNLNNYNHFQLLLIIYTFCKLSNNNSCTLNDGLNGPSVRCRASRATRNILLVNSPTKRYNTYNCHIKSMLSN